MKKLFVAVLAIAALAACQKENSHDVPALDSNCKSVSLVIANQAETRVDTNAGNTAAGDNGQLAVMHNDDLRILFADANGAVLMDLQLVGQNEDEKHEEVLAGNYVPGVGETANEYVWHNVPAAVTQIAVVRYEAADFAEAFVAGKRKLTDYEALATSETLNLKRELEDICLYVGSTLTKDTTAAHKVNGVDYYYYRATVEVAPYFTRFEIHNVQCDDLGDLNADPDPNTFGLDKLVLGDLTWGGKYAISATELGTLYGSYNTPENGKNYVKPATGVWSWNLDPKDLKIPSEANPLLLPMVVSAYDYTVAGYEAALGGANRSIKVVALKDKDGNAVRSFEKENIYVLDLSFDESDIAGQEGICVAVTVTVADWTVVPVKPVFGN